MQTVVGYVRVSTDEQSDSGLGMEAQREALRREAERRGWNLIAVCEDVASGKTLRRRPGLDEALGMVERGDAEGLMVAKLDRLSRSVADFAGILDRFTTRGYGLVVLDLAVDTTTVMGEAMAHVAATFAQMERKRIGERTREALAVRKAQGVKLGRPRVLTDEFRDELRAMRKAGMSYSAIADRLNAEKVPTAQGGARWWPATVAKAL